MKPLQYPKLIESRTSGIEVAFIEWNPSMDLLATVFTNGLLTCSRLLSFQKKVWHKQSNGKIVSIAWRPDGRVLAVGSFNEKTKENVCTLHDVENGNEINLIKKERAIISVSWFQYNEENQQNPLIAPNDGVKKFSHQLAHEQTRLNLLIISTDDGKISFYALGLFCLGEVTGTKDSSSRIVATHMSSCFNLLTAIIHKERRNQISSTFKILYMDTLAIRSNEILRIAKLYARITDELEYLDDTINAITTSWADVLAGLDNKLSSYCSRKNNKADTSKSGYTLLSADELLQLLVIGFPSDNLEKFLADMSDKGLKKLNNAIEQTCLRVQNLNVKNAQKCCYHLHGDLNLLRGMALWRERFQDVGLDEESIVDAMRSVGSLLLKLTELQQVTDHSLKSTKSFFRWLISIACRITGEQNNSVVPNDINKTTQQDIQLITSFINENFDFNSNQDETEMSPGSDEDAGDERPTCSNFTLEQVGQYLKNEPLSRLKYSFTKPGSNFWIEFCNRRPELTKTDCPNNYGSSTLLFYPHSPDTSLIQEHKKTCSSIENAFKSVAANIDVVNQKNTNKREPREPVNFRKISIRNVPTNRVRVETKLSKHYTLFQLQPGRVKKQYLMVNSMEAETYRLFLIRFQSLNDKGSKDDLLISDSCFYENKESKELLLSFLVLHEAMGHTIMIQLNLKRLVQSNQDRTFDYSTGSLYRMFRINDSIDGFANASNILIDITTEPAHLRKQMEEFDCMVKLVKGTTGEDLFASSGRGVLAFTSLGNKRLHLYELETMSGAEIVDDELEIDEKVDDSFIYTDMAV